MSSSDCGGKRVYRAYDKAEALTWADGFRAGLGAIRASTDALEACYYERA